MAAAVGLLLALALCSAAALLASLNRPWLKGRLLASARNATGYEISYDELRLSLLTGLQIDGLAVRSPERFRALAPTLARLARLDVDWSPRALLGRGPWLERLRLSGLTLTVVEDADGDSSLASGAAPTPPRAAAPPAESRSGLLRK
ncbi:MAG: hypothetical protein ACYCWW_16885, partial [Deltaproteobacteria bacterium]